MRRAADSSAGTEESLGQRFTLQQRGKGSSPQHLETLFLIQPAEAEVVCRISAGPWKCLSSLTREPASQSDRGQGAVTVLCPRGTCSTTSVWCFAVWLLKLQRLQKKPPPTPITQKRQIEDIMPLIEKGGTQETLWYIYFF